MEGKRRGRGFASMSPSRRKELASKGGKKAHELGAAHTWSSEEAQAAGQKGGQKTQETLCERAGAPSYTISKGTFTLEEWKQVKEFYSYTCLKCGRREPEIQLHADHVVPLSRGGTNDISNIQPLCKSCNSAKWAFTADYRKTQQGSGVEGLQKKRQNLT